MNPKITFAILVGVAFIDTYFFLRMCIAHTHFQTQLL
jgi:hypothetical protein